MSQNTFYDCTILQSEKVKLNDCYLLISHTPHTIILNIIVHQPKSYNNNRID